MGRGKKRANKRPTAGHHLSLSDSLRRRRFPKQREASKVVHSFEDGWAVEQVTGPHLEAAAFDFTLDDSREQHAYLLRNDQGQLQAAIQSFEPTVVVVDKSGARRQTLLGVTDIRDREDTLLEDKLSDQLVDHLFPWIKGVQDEGAKKPVYLVNPKTRTYDARVENLLSWWQVYQQAPALTEEKRLVERVEDRYRQAISEFVGHIGLDTGAIVGGREGIGEKLFALTDDLCDFLVSRPYAEPQKGEEFAQALVSFFISDPDYAPDDLATLLDEVMTSAEEARQEADLDNEGRGVIAERNNPMDNVTPEDEERGRRNEIAALETFVAVVRRECKKLGVSLDESKDDEDE